MIDKTEFPPFETFKLQRPLAGNAAEGMGYNQDRSKTVLFPMTRAMRRLFREHDNALKLYAKARWHPDGTFEIDEIVSPENW